MNAKQEKAVKRIEEMVGVNADSILDCDGWQTVWVDGHRFSIDLYGQWTRTYA